MYQRIFVSLMLCLALVSMAAAETAPAVEDVQKMEPVQQQQPAQEEPSECESPVDLPALLQEEPIAFAACVVTVNCGNGSTLTCTGSSCYGTDESCSEHDGSCYGSSTGWRYCPGCPPQCPSTVPCSKYEGRSCSSSIACMEGSACANCICVGGTFSCP